MRLLALLELVIWDPSMLADWTVKFTSPKLSGLSLKPTLIQVKFEMTDCIKYNFFPFSWTDQPRPVGNKRGD